MTTALEVAQGEREVVRVFALDLDPPTARGFKTPPEGNGAAWPLPEALGVSVLDPDYVEVFPAGDLKGVGLPAYLIEGQGIDDAVIAPDRAALEAEEGHIVIVLSAAFGGSAQTLTPKPPLRHIGTYRLAEAEAPRATAPAPGDDPPAMVTPAAPPPGPPSRGTSLAVLLGILFAAVAVLALVFFFRSRPY
ncbi:MAG: hypothetical protein QNJ44_06455 [Rhodobacter sp.]|nr:hypothetical protein [Rhodobacter sp.]